MDRPPALEDTTPDIEQALQEAVRRAGADVAAARLHALGAIAAAARAGTTLAQQCPPAGVGSL